MNKIKYIKTLLEIVNALRQGLDNIALAAKQIDFSNAPLETRYKYVTLLRQNPIITGFDESYVYIQSDNPVTTLDTDAIEIDMIFMNQQQIIDKIKCEFSHDNTR